MLWQPGQSLHTTPSNKRVRHVIYKPLPREAQTNAWITSSTCSKCKAVASELQPCSSTAEAASCTHRSSSLLKEVAESDNDCYVSARKIPFRSSFAMDAEIRAARRVKRYADARVREPHSDVLKRVVLAIWDKTRDTATCLAASTWWQFYRPSRLCFARPVTPDDVESWLVQRADSVKLQQRNAEEAIREQFLANQIVAEWRAVLWLLQQNAKGLAVPTPQLLHKYVQQWALPKEGEPPRDYHTEQHLARVQRRDYGPKWAHVFRKRWDISWKKIPARNPLPPDDQRRKVASSEELQQCRRKSWCRSSPTNPRTEKLVAFHPQSGARTRPGIGPIFGTRSGSTFGVRFRTFHSNA